MNINVEIAWLREVILGKIEWRKCPTCAGKGVEYFNGDSGAVWGDMRDSQEVVEDALGDDFAKEACSHCMGLGFIEHQEFVKTFYTKRRIDERKALSEWRGIISRATGRRVKILQPTYTAATLDSRWLDFTSYRDWRAMQFNADFLDENGKPFHIDKDLAYFGNKIYGPDYCSFVPREVNVFFRKNGGKSTSKYTGVHLGAGYQVSATVQCLGVGIKETNYFYDVELAAKWYKETKQKAGRLLAEKWKDKIDSRVVATLRDIPPEFFVKQT